MTRSVEESWGLITNWLKHNLPAAYEALEPPASPEALAAVSNAVGRPLPADLLAWLKLSNGIRTATVFGDLLPPFYTPLACEDMLPRYRMMLSVYRDMPLERGVGPAGSYSFTWLDSFLPLAASGTDVDLFVDLRDGDLHGCVSSLDATEGSSEPVWPSVSAMWSDVAEALTRPADYDFDAVDFTEYLPRLEDGYLSWD